ncbi:MAG: amidophosphoribosyltransferase [Candidatus Omnitrophota bacterium]
MSGIFGVISSENCLKPLLYGTDYHSHLGTEYGGIAVLGDEFQRQIHDIRQSQFKSKFYEDCNRMKGNKGIGVISDSNEQPMFLISRFGPFCLVTSGLIENADELSRELLERGVSFSELRDGSVNVTELISKLINEGKDIVDGIQKMFRSIKGSCSLLLLHRDGIYAARDRWGYTPLALGKSGETWAVSSETSAFPNNGFQTVRHLEPGEIILLSEQGPVSKKTGLKCKQICSFLWIYTGFPASDYDGINTEIVRERCGKAMAKHDKDIKADLVAGIPDSGIGHALGYAMESGIPLRRPLVKYTPGYGRSYTPPSQETRDLVATMKLIPVKEVINSNRIVICEDSIVRGTQLKNFTVKKLWQCGAKEVHVRPASPPLLFPCPFCLSTRSIKELASRKAIHAIEGHDLEDISAYTDTGSDKYQAMIDWIRDDLDVTTLRYQTLDDMIEAINLPREKLCTYCWTGECPGNK